MIYQGSDALEISDEFGFLRKHGLMYQEQSKWVSSAGSGAVWIAYAIIFFVCVIAFAVCCVKLAWNSSNPKLLAEEKSLISHRLFGTIACSVTIGIVAFINMILATL